MLPAGGCNPLPNDAGGMGGGKRDDGTGNGFRSSPDWSPEADVEDKVSREMEKSILGRNRQLSYREVSPQQTTKLPVPSILGSSAG